ncbi:hypothetical protein C8F04DRAFT_1219148 [Mycena alexandri]|uniref:Uncharacterized protein n=1 Tax=Mycena alexandri TaxID=1745969 RepID=A0AAD6XEN3_9AGAR|nr:hypothetical protein C8F04DRAFT_1219148 [Mycena alexandri]
MLRPLARTLGSRAYATVSSGTPSLIRSTPEPIHVVSPELDTVLLNSISASQTGLGSLIQQYTERSGRVLDSSLRYESRPTDSRRITFDNGNSVAMIAHCLNDGTRRHKVTVSSGFALAIPGETNDSLILSCAHTLEEIRRSPFLLDGDHAGSSSGSFLVSGAAGSLSVNSISAVVSAIPRSDILLLRTAALAALPTLPVSPYPVQRETVIRAHFVTHERPQEDGWTPWVGDTWSKWVRGTVLGYRNFAGRETQPGTYDSLSHMLFSPLPTPGSSGGPIVDEESGAVVGVMLGTRMDNRVEGVRGWGIPAETIYELFSLPGLRE